jgi:O-antigen/teichoic acid export membrane protein
MSFGKEAFKILFWRAGSILLSLITGILIARFLGPATRGEYAIISLSIILATITINFGTPEASIYLIGKNHYKFTEIVSTQIFISSIISLLVGLIAFILYYSTNLLTYDYLTLQVFLFAILSIIIQVYLTQIRHFILGLKKFDRFNASIIIENAFFFGLVLLFVSLRMLTLPYVLLSYLLAGALAILFTFPLFTPVYMAFNFGSIRSKLYVDSLKLGSNLYFTGLGGFGIQRINFFILQYFYGVKSVGLYSVVNTLPTFFENLPQQFSTLLYSFISNSKNAEYSIGLSSTVFRITLYISILVSLPLFLFADQIVLLLFGPAYSEISLALIILLSGMVFSGLSGLLINYLAGEGKAKYGTYVTIIVLLVISASGFFLIPEFDYKGAALARTIAGISGFVYVVLTYLNHTKEKLVDIFIIKSEDIKRVKTMYHKIKSKF